MTYHIWAQRVRCQKFPRVAASECRHALGVLSQARTQRDQFQTATQEVATVATVCQACNEKTPKSTVKSIFQGGMSSGWDILLYINHILTIPCPHVHIFLTTPPREGAIIECQGGPRGRECSVCLLSETAGHVDMVAKCLIGNGAACPEPWTLLGHATPTSGHEGTKPFHPRMSSFAPIPSLSTCVLHWLSTQVPTQSQFQTGEHEMNLDERSQRFNALVQLQTLEAQLRIDNMIRERETRLNMIRVSAAGVATLPPDWCPNATPYWHQARNRLALRIMGDHICNPVFSGLAGE